MNKSKYTYRIEPTIYGKVEVRIYSIRRSELFNKDQMTLLYKKEFGSFFNSSPKEKYYKQAKAYADKQLQLIGDSNK